MTMLLKRMRFLLTTLAVVGVMAGPAAATGGGAVDHSGVWEGSYLFSRIEAHLVQENQTVSGVVYLFDMFGSRRQYHFQGRIRNGRIYAFHHSGHHFTGHLLESDKATGVLTTKSGHKLKLEVTRTDTDPGVFD